MSDPRLVALHYWIAQLRLCDLWGLQRDAEDAYTMGTASFKAALQRAIDGILARSQP